MKNKLNNLSDEELMQAYIASDYLAFETLYKRYSGRLYHFFTGRVDKELAGELLQETFTKIHKSRTKYDPEYPFAPWIFTIAKNLLKDHYKKNETTVVKKSYEAEFENLRSEDQLSELGALNEFKTALSQLPPSQKQALELRYLENWSFEQIALKIETSPTNVRKLVSRALKKVRSHFHNSSGESK